MYKNIGMKNVSMKLYSEDRHEILNELDKEQVYDDIVIWIGDLLTDYYDFHYKQKFTEVVHINTHFRDGP